MGAHIWPRSRLLQLFNSFPVSFGGPSNLLDSRLQNGNLSISSGSRSGSRALLALLARVSSCHFFDAEFELGDFAVTFAQIGLLRQDLFFQSTDQFLRGPCH